MLLTKYPQTQFRAAVEKRLGLLDKPKEAPKKEERTEPKLPAYQQRHLEEQAKAERRARWQAEARELAKGYGDPTLSSDERARHAFALAERILYLENYEVAAQQFQRVVSEFPDSDSAEQAAFQLPQLWFRAGQPKRGVEQLHLFLNRYPGSALRPFALYSMGNRLVLYEGDLKGAWPWYEQLLTDYPQHPLSDRTRQFWAKVSELSPEKLKQQVANFVANKTRR